MDNLMMDNQSNYSRNSNKKSLPKYNNMNRPFEPHPMNELNRMNFYNCGNEFGTRRFGGARNKGGRRGSYNGNNNNNNNNNRNNNMSSSFSVNSFISNSNNEMNGVGHINNNGINNMSRSISFNSGNSNCRGGQNRSGGNRSGNRNKKKKQFNINSINIDNSNIGSFESNNEIKVSSPINGCNSRFNNQIHFNSLNLMNNSIFEDTELSHCFDTNITNSTCFDSLTDNINSYIPNSNFECSFNTQLGQVVIELPEEQSTMNLIDLKDSNDVAVDLCQNNQYEQSKDLIDCSLEPLTEEKLAVHIIDNMVYYNKQTELNEEIENSMNKTEEDSGICDEKKSSFINDDLETDKSLPLVEELNEENNESKTKNDDLVTPIESYLEGLSINNHKEISKEVMVNKSDRLYKLVFAGDSAVGKTSFIMKLCKGEFSDVTSATLGVDFYMKSLNVDNENEVKLQLWDTCGQERFRSIAKSYFRRADGVVLMYDVTCEQSFLNVREWIQTITDITDRTIPIIIIGNKTDLRDSYAKNGTRVIDYQEGLKFAKDYKALFVETSIKENTNVENSLVNLCKIMAENEDQTASNSIQIKLQSLTNINTKKFFSFKNRCC